MSTKRNCWPKEWKKSKENKNGRRKKKWEKSPRIPRFGCKYARNYAHTLNQASTFLMKCVPFSTFQMYVVTVSVIVLPGYLQFNSTAEVSGKKSSMPYAHNKSSSSNSSESESSKKIEAKKRLCLCEQKKPLFAFEKVIFHKSVAKKTLCYFTCVVLVLSVTKIHAFSMTMAALWLRQSTQQSDKHSWCPHLWHFRRENEKGFRQKVQSQSNRP